MPAIEDGGTWGILGGAFDPVHNGHLNLARQLLIVQDLSGVIFIPSCFHPCKNSRESTSYQDRVAMLKLALEPQLDFEICEIEADQQLSGYTLDTIRALKTTYTTASFRFIIGADNLRQLPSWHKPEELLEEVVFLVGSRPGFDFGPQWQLPCDRIELIPIEPVDISSSLVRQSLKEGISGVILDRLVPASVCEYIASHRLYQ
ncbi:MAG: nicotinate (nicotinamide) nucleotide adenylyltransferase [candidate division Zixibacteria bacterium]|nr:nicotinate (nicotinamide) nucleotide adenylyltransferase [candidate division Zixibacteria bacterium]